jgi:hypothetical protein
MMQSLNFEALSAEKHYSMMKEQQVAAQKARIRVIICENHAFKQKQQNNSILFETMRCEALISIFALFQQIRNKKIITQRCINTVCLEWVPRKQSIIVVFSIITQQNT